MIVSRLLIRIPYVCKNLIRSLFILTLLWYSSLYAQQGARGFG